MLVARRLYPEAPNHKLGTLVDYRAFDHNGVFHRALADSEMTARLWLVMLDDIKQRYGISDLTFDLMLKLSKTPKGKVDALLQRH